jgi:methyl-accepting chemotaxis protein
MSWKWSDLKLRTKLLFGFMYFFIFYLLLQTIVQYDFSYIEGDTSEYTTLKDESETLYSELNKQNLNLFLGMAQVNSQDNTDKLMLARTIIQANRTAIQSVQTNLKINPAYADLASSYNQIYDLMGDLEPQIDLIHSDWKNNAPTLAANLGKLHEMLTQLSLQTIELSHINNDLTLTFQKQIDDRLDGLKMEMYIVGTVGILIVGLMIFFIAISLGNSARKLQRFTSHLVNGELWAEPQLHSKDEFGLISNEIDKVRLKMREVMMAIEESTKGMLAASQEFSSGSTIISSGASEQAATSNEISSTMDIVAQGIREASEKAVSTSVLAKNAYREVESGVQKVVETAEAIELIAQKNKVIGEISYQTKILSINASVEAARAAEFGKGFSVVAEEVKKLAESTQESATDIREVSKRGVNLSHESAKMLNAIVPHIKETVQLIESIGQAGTEHIVGIEQITRSIQELNNVIQQNAASSEELASSSEELVRTVESLRDQVSFFKFEKEEDDAVEIETENDSDTRNENSFVQSDDEDREYVPSGSFLSSTSWDNQEPENRKDDAATFSNNFENWLKNRKSDSWATPDVEPHVSKAARSHNDLFDTDKADLNVYDESTDNKFESETERIRYPQVEEPKIDLSAFTPKLKPKTKQPKSDHFVERQSTSTGVRINLSDNDDLDSQFEKVK